MYDELAQKGILRHLKCKNYFCTKISSLEMLLTAKLNDCMCFTKKLNER